MFNQAQMDEFIIDSQRINSNLQKAQNELADLEITGKAGNGAVTVIMNGRNKFKQVLLDTTILNDKKKLEDLIVIAANNAIQNIEEHTMNKLLSLAENTTDSFTHMLTRYS